MGRKSPRPRVPASLRLLDDPVIRATGNVSFDTYQGASLHIFAGGSVNLGSVTITGTDATNFINETVPLSQTLPDGTNTVTINGSTRPTLDIRAGTLAVGTPVNVCVGCPLFQPTNLTFPNIPLTADITINQIVINRPDGLIFLTNQYQPNPALAGNIQITGIFADAGNGGFIGKGSDVVIDSRGNMTLAEDGRIRTDSATGNGANVTLIANGSFSMLPRSQMYTYISGQGKAGDITIKVGDAVSLIGDRNPNAVPTIINANVESGGVGDGGEITIEAGSLSIDDAQIQAGIRQAGGFFTPPGQGNAGNVNINVRNAVNITGANSGIFTVLDVGATGNSGNINIQAGVLTLTDGGVLQAGVLSQGEGKAGNITLDVRDITIAGVNAASGSSSRVSVATSRGSRRLTIQNGGRIEAGTFGNGLGGTVTVNASESIELIGTSADGTFVSGISAYSRPPLDFDANLWQGNANSGGVNVTTNQLIIRDGAEVTTAVEGTSQTGNAGDIKVQANSLSLTNGGRITTRSDGVSNAGNINVNVSDNFLSSGGNITATSTQLGGGNITLKADDIRLSHSSLISTSVKESTGGGGNITINSTVFLAIEDSDILANAAAFDQ